MLTPVEGDGRLFSPYWLVSRTSSPENFKVFGPYGDARSHDPLMNLDLIFMGNVNVDRLPKVGSYRTSTLHYLFSFVCCFDCEMQVVDHLAFRQCPQFVFAVPLDWKD